jgi:hypothetical protein
MKTLWDPAARRELVARLERLTPADRAAWGQMTATQMLAHVVDTFRMGLGELPTRGKNTPFRHAPLKQLIVYLLPFPKSAPTAPELLARAPGEWDAERRACVSYIERFASEPRDRDWPEHPAFGTLSARAWGVLGYKHTDHHLRQFGA